MSVPALAKNFWKGIERAIREKGPLAERLLSLGLRVAYAYNGMGSDRGAGWRKLLKAPLAFFELILFSKIRRNFGGQMEYFIGGGALLDIELQRFFYAIGIPMYQGYGLTEASPVISANTPTSRRLGSSGRLVPDLELKICNEKGESLPAGERGEIIVRGENVMAGYWRNPEASAETLRGGWLFTGDLGYMSADGFLYVLGREKSLLIGHDGEKYSPEGIEETITENSPHIDQIILHNDQSPSTVALLVPNREALVRTLKHRGIPADSPQASDAALRILDEDLAAYRTGGRHGGVFPDRWLPSAFAVLSEPFTEQNRFLNSTLKMVRGRIAQHYAARIATLYTAEGRNLCSQQNRAEIEVVLGRE
jgi:long-chain acyl-CoA synthetase